MNQCAHDHKFRYSDGFYCENCDQFFHKDSPTYPGSELLSTLWLALHNLNAQRSMAGLTQAEDAEEMMDKIGTGTIHEHPEFLIRGARAILKRYEFDEESIYVALFSEHSGE